MLLSIPIGNVEDSDVIVRDGSYAFTISRVLPLIWHIMDIFIQICVLNIVFLQFYIIQYQIYSGANATTFKIIMIDSKANKILIY